MCPLKISFIIKNAVDYPSGNLAIDAGYPAQSTGVLQII
jgi:hypothetical protein